MIEIQQLHKKFGAISVLQDISLTIEGGEVTAILGPNGSGKTTLMKSIVGLVQPDSGSLTVFGESIAGKAEYRRFIGYMAQIARFEEHLSARELIALLKELRQQQGIPQTVRDRELITALELEPHLDKALRSLSGGTRQKVNAVLALMFEPKILLLDEPTAGLDPVAAGTLKDIIHEEKKRGTAIVLTSHIMNEIEELADTIVFLLEGKVYFYGSMGALLESSGERTVERAIAHLMKNAPAQIPV